MTKKRFNYGDREQRLRKAYERLGTDNPKCLICCGTNPLCLELHHPAQHAFAPETIILCSNHHDDASDWQKDHPEKIADCNSILETIGHWLLGLGDLCHIAAHEPSIGSLKEFLHYLASTLRAFGHHLIKLPGSMAATAEITP
jgi:hypothetical protein